jgi:threonine dehydratase
MIQQQVKNGFPTLDDVHAAAERLEGLVVKTYNLQLHLKSGVL